MLYSSKKIVLGKKFKKITHTPLQTHTCQVDIYRYLWLILSLDKYSQGVSQLHITLCKTHKQNTNVQYSYTLRTVKHPRLKVLLQEVIHIQITRRYKVLHMEHRQQIHVE